MKFEDSVAQTLFWKYLNDVKEENGVEHVKFKGFKVDNAHANWRVVRKIYGNGDRDYLSLFVLLSMSNDGSIVLPKC